MVQSSAAERAELRDVVRDFLAAHAGLPAVRRAMSEGYDPSLWRRLAAGIGAAGLAVPAEFGGAGCGFEEVSIVCEEIGRAVAPVPYLSTAVLAVGAILAAGDREAAGRLLPGICAGETVATVIVGTDAKRLPPPDAGTLGWDRDLGWDTGLFTGATGTLAARRDGDSLLISGSAAPIIDGHVAGVLIVLADGETGPVCAQVAGSAPGLRRTRLPALDQTRQLAALEFSGVPAVPIGGAPGLPIGGAIGGASGEEAACAASRVASKVAALGAAALAAEQAAGAERCLELAVSHAKDRVQFGRPIGSFQAVKHKLAEMLVATESARSAARYAASAACAEPGRFGVYASLAKSYCSEAYLAVAGECIQVHGGIGVTWEHPAHLYFKRATADAILFGTPVRHREWLRRPAGLAGLP